MKNADPKTRKRYWQEFTKVCEENEAPLQPHTPSGAPNAIDVNLGPNLDLKLRASAVLGARITGYSNSNITIRISVSKELWEVLETEWSDIKSKFGDKGLSHKPLDNKGKFPGGQQIFLCKTDTDAADESDWQKQFRWFILNFWKFAEIFRKHFRQHLDPFNQPFKSNKLDSEPDSKRFEENTKDLLEIVRREIEFLERQISHLNRRKSELQNALLNYE